MTTRKKKSAKTVFAFQNEDALMESLKRVPNHHGVCQFVYQLADELAAITGQTPPYRKHKTLPR